MDVMFSRAFAERIASNGYEPDPQDVLDAYIAVLYLDGCGSMKFDLPSGAHIDIPVQPGRLVVWPNRECKHAFVDTSEDGDVRHLLGPMAMSAETEWRSVAHTFSWMGGMEQGPPRKVQEAKPKPKEVRVITVARSPEPDVLVFRNVAGDELCSLDFADGDTVEKIQARLRGHLAVPSFRRISLVLPSGELLLPHEKMASVFSPGPTVGDTVCVAGADRVGEILLHDPSDSTLTYKIRFNDGAAPAADWFARGAVSKQAPPAETSRLSFQIAK